MSKELPDKIDLYVWFSAALLIAGGIVFLFFRISENLSARRGMMHFQCMRNCEVIGFALKMYFDDNEETYPATLTALTPDYLRTIPTCAAAGSGRGYIDSYRVSNDYKDYSFYCMGHYHKTEGWKRNYPQYSSRKGIELGR